jgi:hypothetical protein
VDPGADFADGNDHEQSQKNHQAYEVNHRLTAAIDRFATEALQDKHGEPSPIESGQGEKIEKGDVDGEHGNEVQEILQAV